MSVFLYCRLWLLFLKVLHCFHDFFNLLLFFLKLDIYFWFLWVKVPLASFDLVNFARLLLEFLSLNLRFEDLYARIFGYNFCIHIFLLNNNFDGFNQVYIGESAWEIFLARRSEYYKIVLLLIYLIKLRNVLMRIFSDILGCFLSGTLLFRWLASRRPFLSGYMLGFYFSYF